MLKFIKKYTVIILLLSLMVYFSLEAKGFATIDNMISLMRQVAVLGMVSAGMTIIIITGNIDLSVGSQVSLVACFTAIMIVNYKMNPIAACLLGILIAMLVSTLNAAVILGTKMPAMLCTLASMSIWQGVAYMITGAVPVFGLPEGMRMLGQGYIWKIPIPVVIMITVLGACSFLLSKTYPGRCFYAVGSNEEASRLSGIAVSRCKVAAYTISGFFVGLAGLVLLSRMFSGHPTAGSGLEMDAITAVVVGGVSFSGGHGKISGVVQGVLMMGVLSNGLGIMGMGTYAQLIFKGIVLVLVVGLDCYQHAHQTQAKMIIKMDNKK